MDPQGHRTGSAGRRVLLARAITVAAAAATLSTVFSTSPPLAPAPQRHGPPAAVVEKPPAADASGSSPEVRWLAAQATSIVQSSCVRALDDVGGSGCLFQPQAGSGYGGQFTRDYTYALINSPPNAFNLTEAIWATEQVLAHQREDGLLPDMLARDPATGRALPSYFSVGMLPCLYPDAKAAPDMPLPRPACCPDNCTQIGSDSAQFATFNVIFLAQQLERTQGISVAAAFLGRHHAALVKALAQVPRYLDTGLVGSDASNPRIGYGFQDTVVLTGAQTFASVLMYEAALSLCSSEKHYGKHKTFVNLTLSNTFDGCKVGRRLAQTLSPKLWNSDLGMLRAASGLGSKQTDVWASAYAALLSSGWSWLRSPLWRVRLDPPLLTPAKRDSVIAYLHDNIERLFIAGQARNLPTGQVWTQQYCVPASVAASAPPLAPRCANDSVDLNLPGYYQNGGGWAVALHHMLPVLALNGSDSACGLVREFVDNVRCHGDINEWVDGFGLPRGVGNYSASATNAYAGAVALHCHLNQSARQTRGVNDEARVPPTAIASSQCANLSGRWYFSGYRPGHYDVWMELPSIIAKGTRLRTRTVQITSVAPGDDAWHTATATIVAHLSPTCPAPTEAAGATVNFVYNTSVALGHVSVATGQLRNNCTRVEYASCACSGNQCSHYTRLTGPTGADINTVPPWPAR